MTESEQLLQEAKELALEEKKTYERIITKLKQEVTALSKQFQETERKHELALKKLEREHQTKCVGRLCVLDDAWRRCSPTLSFLMLVATESKRSSDGAQKEATTRADSASKSSRHS